MKSLRLSPAARTDLREIWRYTSTTWNETQADRYVNLIVSACSRLAAGDISGQSVEHLREGYLRIAVESHFVFYKITGAGKRIDVMRVLHQRMNLPAHLRHR